MKKIAENRYPNSATLFKFCKEALEMRYEGNVKVIDQDVGAILGYDPADCSHWKKGKKNIRSLSTLKTIADHLSIDERLLIDVAAGRVGLDEAIFEFRGYGAFGLGGKNSETLRKEYVKNPVKYTGEDTSLTFEDIFDVDRTGVVRVVESIQKTLNFQEAPIYIPELCAAYPSVKIVTDDQLKEPFQAQIEVEAESEKLTFKVRSQEMQPFVRYALIREFFKHLVRTKNSVVSKLTVCPTEVIEIRANLFAANFLIPGTFLRKEIDRVDATKDIITQLSETFWVSKALMNQRLVDYMEYKN